MFQNLLVPLDGSRMAESALPAAAYLAPKLRARVTLVHCIERAAPEKVHGERHLSDPEEARAYLESTAARAFPAGAQIVCHTHAPEVDDVAPSILEHAKEMPSTLIVMCTHGHSGLGNLLLGNIAQRIVGSGLTPVLLIPPTRALAREGAFACHRILTPLDGYPAHEQALPVAAEIAAACGSEIRLVFVVATRGSLPGTDAAVGLLLPRATRAVLEIARQEAAAYLARIAQAQQAAGRALSSEICRGVAPKTIARAAQRSHADLIVMATHSEERNGRLLVRQRSPESRQLLQAPLAARSD